MKRLSKNDPVLNCVRTMPKLLAPLKGNSLLVNGKIEMQLKAVIGAAWETKGMATRSYVMDKGFKRLKKRSSGRPKNATGYVKIGGLDLLAFEHGEPAFWIETKCSFFEDAEDGRRNAHSAARQTKVTFARLIPELSTCPVYIVHFLNSIPPLNVPSQGVLRSQFVLDKFKRLRKKEQMTAEALAEIYTARLRPKHFHSSAIVRISSEPIVDAVVVKLKPGHRHRQAVEVGKVRRRGGVPPSGSALPRQESARL